MSDPDAIAESFLACLGHARRRAHPFRHWLLDGILPSGVLRDVDTMDIAPPCITDTLGKRETHNISRVFFNPPQRRRHPVCQAIAAALQDTVVVRQLQATCGTELSGSSLRIEYCLDTDGFWLAPHTDIGAKLFTMLICLSDDPGCEAWGTDLLDTRMRIVLTTPYHRNGGCIFIPAADTWHGVQRRPIVGVRRSLIVNYVKPEWRSRHELAFPDQPVSA